MNEEHRIIHEQIANNVFTYRVLDWEAKLHRMYDRLNKQWFEGQLPRISDSFACELCDLPYGTTSICVTEEWAEKWSTGDCRVRPGTRINAGLKCSPEHVAIALLHEMVHASGILGHEDNFWDAIDKLARAGAYDRLL